MSLPIREVILSDGTETLVVLPSRNRAKTTYYPDLPHCCVCDQSQADVTLYLCDAPQTGPEPSRCCRYICEEHVQTTPDGAHRCPPHALAQGDETCEN